MCYICKDYGRHKGHAHNLLELEAEQWRTTVQNAVKHLRKSHKPCLSFSSRVLSDASVSSDPQHFVNAILGCLDRYVVVVVVEELVSFIKWYVHEILHAMP